MATIAVGTCVLVVAATARNHHVQTRRIERWNKACQIILELANEGCNLHHFRLMCKRYNSFFDSVEEAEIQKLSKNPTIQENAKYLMGLYGRSKTTKQFVKRAAEIGTQEILRMHNNHVVNKLQSIPQEAKKADGLVVDEFVGGVVKEVASEVVKEFVVSPLLELLSGGILST
jgi:hypothetical protein